MSALAEALLAAQRQAVGSLSKAFVAGAIDGEMLLTQLDIIGLKDDIDQGLLLQALSVVAMLGADAPKPTGQTAGPKLPELPSDGQRKYIADLCKRQNVPEPDVISSKDQAHEIIDALKAGTYNADAYSVPF